MIAQSVNSELVFSVFDLCDTILIRAKNAHTIYELERMVDPVIKVQEIQNAIAHKNFVIISETAESLSLKFSFSNLELTAIKNPLQQLSQSQYHKVINTSNIIENQRQRIQTLEIQNIQLRTEVDQLTLRMNQMDLKMKELIQKSNENQLLKQQVFKLKKQIRLKQDDNPQEIEELEAVLIIRKVVSSNQDIIRSSSIRVQQQQHEPSDIKMTQELKKAFELIAFTQQVYFKNFELSTILETEQEKQTLRGFFNYKISSAKQLYCASRNEFSLKAFHESCDYSPNSLILIKTEFGKKIGGFTPLGWDQDPTEQKFYEDENGLSFIFSLSYKEKFPVKNKKFAILRRRGLGPIFGNDMVLGERCNQCETLYTNCNGKKCIYGSEKPVKDHWLEKETLAGNAYGLNHCKVLEWEVWNLNFIYEDEPQIQLNVQ